MFHAQCGHCESHRAVAALASAPADVHPAACARPAILRTAPPCNTPGQQQPPRRWIPAASKRAGRRGAAAPCWPACAQDGDACAAALMTVSPKLEPFTTKAGSRHVWLGTLRVTPFRMQRSVYGRILCACSCWCTVSGQPSTHRGVVAAASCGLANDAPYGSLPALLACLWRRSLRMTRRGIIVV